MDINALGTFFVTRHTRADEERGRAELVGAAPIRRTTPLVATLIVGLLATALSDEVRERFRGEAEPIDRRAGHVPGAVNRPYAMNLVDGRFKPSAQLAQEFDTLLGAHAPETVVAMCGSGVTACHHLLAMAHAGLPGAKLFTGSWSGWIEDPERPVAMG